MNRLVRTGRRVGSLLCAGAAIQARQWAGVNEGAIIRLDCHIIRRERDTGGEA